MRVSRPCDTLNPQCVRWMAAGAMSSLRLCGLDHTTMRCDLRQLMIAPMHLQEAHAGARDLQRVSTETTTGDERGTTQPSGTRIASVTQHQRGRRGRMRTAMVATSAIGMLLATSAAGQIEMAAGTSEEIGTDMKDQEARATGGNCNATRARRRLAHLSSVSMRTAAATTSKARVCWAATKRAQA